MEVTGKMNKLHVKTGDTVIVLSGDDKGVRTKVQVEDGKKIRVCAKCGAKL